MLSTTQTFEATNSSNHDYDGYGIANRAASCITVSNIPTNAIIESVTIGWNVDVSSANDLATDVYFELDSPSAFGFYSAQEKISTYSTEDWDNGFVEPYISSAEGFGKRYNFNSTGNVNGDWWFNVWDANSSGTNEGRIDSWTIIVEYHEPGVTNCDWQVSGSTVTEKYQGETVSLYVSSDGYPTGQQFQAKIYRDNETLITTKTLTANSNGNATINWTIPTSLVEDDYYFEVNGVQSGNLFIKSPEVTSCSWANTTDVYGGNTLELEAQTAGYANGTQLIATVYKDVLGTDNPIAAQIEMTVNNNVATGSWKTSSSTPVDQYFFIVDGKKSNNVDLNQPEIVDVLWWEQYSEGSFDGGILDIPKLGFYILTKGYDNEILECTLYCDDIIVAEIMTSEETSNYDGFTEHYPSIDCIDFSDRPAGIYSLKVESVKFSNNIVILDCPQNLIVSTTKDELDTDTSFGDLSLREAIALANLRSGHDIITFDSSLSGKEITLSGEYLRIAGDIDIIGLGADKLTIDADGKSEIFHIEDGTNLTNYIVRINGLCLSGGYSNDEASASAISVYFSNLTIQDCIITNNSVNVGLGTGAIYSCASNLSIINSEIYDNDGSGIYYYGGCENHVLYVINSKVHDNRATCGGGLELAFSYSIGNTIINSAIYNNFVTEFGCGGGIDVDTSKVTLVNTTVSGNFASCGGGISIVCGFEDSLVLYNSIIASNTSELEGQDIYGIVYAGSNNFIGGEPLFVDPTNGNYQLRNDSPCINAGNNSLAVDADGNPLTTDLAGNARISGGTVDIGAYEFNSGNLLATVRNTDGVAVAGVEVVAYRQVGGGCEEYARLTTNSVGVASFENLPIGMYNLEAYYNGEFWGALWDSENGAVEVTADGNTSTQIYRTEPYAYNFSATRDGQNVIGGNVYLGDELTYSVKVANGSSSVDREVRIRLTLSTTMDGNNEFSSTSVSKVIHAGQDATFDFTDDITLLGNYHYSFVVETNINGNWVKTDSWGWNEAFSVVDNKMAISGSLSYCDTDGLPKCAANVYVQVKEKQSLIGDDYVIAEGFTNSDGWFYFETDVDGNFIYNIDSGLMGSGTRDLYFVFKTSNYAGFITSGSLNIFPYTFETSTDENVTELNYFNTWYISSINYTETNPDVWGIPGKIMAAKQALYDLSGCVMPQIRVEYPVSVDNSTAQYDPFSNVIEIEESSTTMKTIAHEYGHAIQDKARNDNWNSSTGPSPHSITSESNQEFAFIEGWAEFYSAVVLGDPTQFSWIRGIEFSDYSDILGGIPIWWGKEIAGENLDWWNSDGNTGEIVEGAVASILWDIYDGLGNLDQDNDGIDSQWDKLWEIFLNDDPVSIWDTNGDDADDFYHCWLTRFGASSELDKIFVDHGIRVADDSYDNNDGNDSFYTASTIESDEHISNLICTDQDWYKFQIDSKLEQDSKISIEFLANQGFLNVALYNSSTQQLVFLNGRSDAEIVDNVTLLSIDISSLNTGTYYLKVTGYGDLGELNTGTDYEGDMSPSYSLNLDLEETQLLINNSNSREFTVEYGISDVGTKTTACYYTFQNASETDILIDNIQITGDDSDDYYYWGLSEFGQDSFTLAAGNSQSIYIGFLPDNAGECDAVLACDAYVNGQFYTNISFTLIGAGVLQAGSRTVLSGWQDVEKILPDAVSGQYPGTGDDYMCWAATASNLLYWGDWYDSAQISSVDDIFDEYIDYWSDGGYDTRLALKWWFDGDDVSYANSSTAYNNVAGGGGYYPGIPYTDFVNVLPIDDLMSNIKKAIDDDIAIALSISNGDGSHAISCWGYQLDGGEIVGLWVTDSDDYKNYQVQSDRLRYYSVSYNAETGYWELPEFGYHITRATSIESNKMTVVSTGVDLDLGAGITNGKLLDMDGDGMPDIIIDVDAGQSYSVTNLSGSTQITVNSSLVSQDDPEVQITVNKADGWIYTSFSDPFNGTRELLSVTTSDGRVIAPNNWWIDDSGNICLLDDPDVVYELDYENPAAVIGRHIFYNNSSFDTVNDDNAIATDKQALLAGSKATFANYTSYTRGINGIMVDISGLAGSVTASDFTFKIGNNDTTSTWTAAPLPTSVMIRTGAGYSGSDRIVIAWADGAIVNKWLEVTVLANENTGLVLNDVFYFGNAIGETGNSTLNASVNISDMALSRVNQTGFTQAGITNLYDFNRDKKVNVTDIGLVRGHQSGFSPLRLIDLTTSEGMATTSDIILSGRTNNKAAIQSQFIKSIWLDSDEEEDEDSLLAILQTV